MSEVVGIRFKEVGKIYYFDPIGFKLNKGDRAIVETKSILLKLSLNLECGEVAQANKDVNDDEIVKPLKPIVRVATAEDLKVVERNKKKEKEAFDICLKKIALHGLDMKLIDVEYTFDSSKVIFYFTSDGRVDFRELVKDLASVFRIRIELRQIGVRDESKMKGGLGMCGRPFCCNSFLGDFQPVSIKMAKEQGLSLNPTKISGTCGRLMCCLKYEQESYEHLLRVTPKVGAIVDTSSGRGTVVETDLLKGMLKVRLDRSPEAAPAVFSRRDVKLIKDKKITVNKSELAALKEIEG
mgnify:CR=1 FL=1